MEIKDYMDDGQTKLYDSLTDEQQEEFYLDVKWNTPTEGIYESIQLAFSNIKESTK